MSYDAEVKKELAKLKKHASQKRVHKSKYSLVRWWETLHGVAQVFVVLVVSITILVAANLVWTKGDETTRPDRLVNMVHEYVVYPDIFTVDKIVGLKENTNPKGFSYTFSGTFKIPAKDMERLLDSPAPLSCKPSSKCVIEKTVHYDEANRPNPGYSGRVKNSDNATEFSLNFYPKENKVGWNYYVY